MIVASLVLGAVLGLIVLIGGGRSPGRGGEKRFVIERPPIIGNLLDKAGDLQHFTAACGLDRATFKVAKCVTFEGETDES
jgi:hypothetical protein